MQTKESAVRRTTYHHGDLRAQLIEATRHLVEAKGPDNFSVSEACRTAGVSTAAPYKHFKDKEEMLREVALNGMERQREEMLAEIEPFEIGELHRIIGLGRVYTRFATREPGVFRLMFGLSEDHGTCADLVEMGSSVFGVVQLEVARYRGSEIVEEQDARRAFLLWSFVHGLSFLSIDGKLERQGMPGSIEDMLLDVAERVMRSD